MMHVFQFFMYGLAGVVLVRASELSAQGSGRVSTQHSSAQTSSQPVSIAYAGSMLARPANASKNINSLRPPFVRSGHRFTLPSQSASVLLGTITPPVGRPSERFSSSMLTSNTGRVDVTAGRHSSVPASGHASEQIGTGVSSFHASLNSTSVQNVYIFASIPLTGGISGITASEGTVMPGGPPVTISGHVFSLGAAGASIAIDGATSSLLPPTTNAGAAPALSSPTAFPELSRTALSGSDRIPPSAPLTTPAFQDSQRESHRSSATSAGEVKPDTITSTDTVAPTDASTEGATNTAWTENIWLTTEKDGQQTVVPVIVGCPGCGGRGGGIILWNFPPIPEVSFRFPGFPGLPTVSFPCIPIPLIKSCSSPPSSHEGAHGSDSGHNPPDPSGGSDQTNSLPSETVSKSTKTEASHTTETSSIRSSWTTLSTTTSNATLASTSNFACPLTSYTFSLAPGIDLFTLRTDSDISSTLPQKQSQLQSSSSTFSFHSNSLPTTALAPTAPISLSKTPSLTTIPPIIDVRPSTTMASAAIAFSAIASSVAAFSTIPSSTIPSSTIPSSAPMISSSASMVSSSASMVSSSASITSSSASGDPFSIVSSSTVSLSTSTTTTSAVASSAVASSAVPPTTSTISSLAVPSTAVASSGVSFSTTPSLAVFSSAVPSSAVPSSAVPSSAVPSSAVPSSAVPSSAVPSSAVPSSVIAASSTNAASSFSTDAASSAMASSTAVPTSPILPISETAPPPTLAASSMPPTPTVAPAIPPAPASCEPMPTTHVQDSHEDQLIMVASEFCLNYASATSTITINAQYTIGPILGGNGMNDPTDDVYAVSVEEVPSCLPDGGAYDPQEPVVGSMCADILHSAWQQCSNQGRGGSIIAGCLVYSLRTVF